MKRAVIVHITKNVGLVYPSRGNFLHCILRDLVLNYLPLDLYSHTSVTLRTEVLSNTNISSRRSRGKRSIGDGDWRREDGGEGREDEDGGGKGSGGMVIEGVVAGWWDVLIEWIECIWPVFIDYQNIQ